jgi:hypothetical protein
MQINKEVGTVNFEQFNSSKHRHFGEIHDSLSGFKEREAQKSPMFASQTNMMHSNKKTQNRWRNNKVARNASNYEGLQKVN